jgi:hypothetical protein
VLGDIGDGGVVRGGFGGEGEVRFVMNRCNLT